MKLTVTTLHPDGTNGKAGKVKVNFHPQYRINGSTKGYYSNDATEWISLKSFNDLGAPSLPSWTGSGEMYYPCTVSILKDWALLGRIYLTFTHSLETGRTVIAEEAPSGETQEIKISESSTVEDEILF